MLHSPPPSAEFWQTYLTREVLLEDSKEKSWDKEDWVAQFFCCFGQFVKEIFRALSINATGGFLLGKILGGKRKGEREGG